ncbi:MAG: hypothetical protein QNK04_04435 [Myxococcota bacterium]|nr:hypothetical protein [Myxococcota bacterium]
MSGWHNQDPLAKIRAPKHEEVALNRVREYAGRTLLVLMSPLVVWGLLEGAAWLAGVEPLSEQRAYRGFARHRACQFGWRDAERLCAAEDLQHPGRELVVTLGGSSVFGYPADRAVPLARPLGRLLEESAPGRWRAANRGFPCKDTIFVRDCAGHALAAGARVLAIYAGHNDFANWWPRNPRRRIWLEENAWIFRIDEALAATRTYSLLVGAFGASLGEAPKAPPEPEVAAAAREVVLAQFEADVSEVIVRAGEHGADVILVTVVSNLHEFPVRRERWDDGVAALLRKRPELGDWAESYRQGITLHRQGRFAEAITAFAEARDRHPRGRAQSPLNERVRTLAARYENAHLVDFERRLHASGAEEGIGCSFFGDEGYCDQFHPNARTQRMIARAIFDEMERMGWVGGAASSTTRSERGG